MSPRKPRQQYIGLAVQGLKYCPGCQDTRPLEAFNWANRAKGIRQGYCRACFHAKAVTYRTEHRLQVKARRKAEYARHRPRYHAANHARSAKRQLDAHLAARERLRRQQWAKANAAKVRQSARATYQRHKVQKQAKRRAYRRAHPAQVALENAKRRALRRHAFSEPISPAQWQAVIHLYGSRCAYCGKRPKKLTIDHVIPLIKGGSHTLSNLVPACLSCNSGKQHRPAPPFQAAFTAMFSH